MPEAQLEADVFGAGGFAPQEVLSENGEPEADASKIDEADASKIDEMSKDPEMLTTMSHVCCFEAREFSRS